MHRRDIAQRAVGNQERMRPTGSALLSISVATALLTVAFVGVAGAQNAPTKFVVIDQKVDQATLHRYNHIDQGTRLKPAAWLAALETADGSGKFMSTENLRRLGFIVDNIVKDETNEYGWPVGLTVSDPKTSGGIAMAGVNCAACHTGQIEYKGTAIRINGGQGMLDSSGFFRGVFAALVAADSNPERRAKFFADAIKAGYPADKMAADFQATVAALRASPARLRLPNTVEGFGRTDALQSLANGLLGRDIQVPANVKPRNGPVVFPIFGTSGA